MELYGTALVQSLCMHIQPLCRSDWELLSITMWHNRVLTFMGHVFTLLAFARLKWSTLIVLTSTHFECLCDCHDCPSFLLGLVGPFYCHYYPDVQITLSSLSLLPHKSSSSAQFALQDPLLSHFTILEFFLRNIWLTFLCLWHGLVP